MMETEERERSFHEAGHSAVAAKLSDAVCWKHEVAGQGVFRIHSLECWSKACY